MHDAKELAQSGIAKVIDPDDCPWDEEAQPSILLRVGSVMKAPASNKNRGDGRHPVVSLDASRDRRVDQAPTPEERIDHAEDLALVRAAEADRFDVVARLARGESRRLALVETVVRFGREVAKRKPSTR